jgi:hypothetical protein
MPCRIDVVAGSLTENDVVTSSSDAERKSLIFLCQA